MGDRCCLYYYVTWWYFIVNAYLERGHHISKKCVRSNNKMWKILTCPCINNSLALYHHHRYMYVCNVVVFTFLSLFQSSRQQDRIEFCTTLLLTYFAGGVLIFPFAMDILTYCLKICRIRRVVVDDSLGWVVKYSRLAKSVIDLTILVIPYAQSWMSRFAYLFYKLNRKEKSHDSLNSFSLRLF